MSDEASVKFTVVDVGSGRGLRSWRSGAGSGAATLQGRVDTTLPAELQAKQQAVRRLLNGLQEGVGDAAGLAIYAPGIVYREKFEDFFNGAGQLARWEFSGRPQGNEVPVVLYFDDQNSGLVNPENVRREERVYLVSGSGQQYTISRK